MLHALILDAREDVGEQTMKLSLLAVLLSVLALIWAPMPRLASDTVVPNREQPKPPTRRTVLPTRPDRPVRPPSLERPAARVPMPAIALPDLQPELDHPRVDDAPALVVTRDWDVAPDSPPESASPIAMGTLGLEPPVITKRLQPNYPPTAAKIGLQGSVILEAILAADGTIREIRVLRQIAGGKFDFERAAQEALIQWDFVPGRLRGKPVDVRMTLAVDFRLQR